MLTLFASAGLQYRRCLEQPVLILVLLAFSLIWAGWQLPNFRIDASAASLISQADPELAYYREVSEAFEQAPFLVLTVRPHDDLLFTRSGVQLMASIIANLRDIPEVGQVSSLLDAPLLASPPMTLSELSRGQYRTLLSNDVDLAAAREELTESAIFRDLAISSDGKTAAIQIELHTAQTSRDEERLIKQVRAVQSQFADTATLRLGGIPMMRSDMLQIIGEDMMLFSIIIIGLLALALFLFFQRLRWVLIPLGTTAVTLVLTCGLLAALEQPVTAISSSFITLLSIITISFTIHLITRYRELFSQPQIDSQCTLAFETMRSKLVPCVFTALTTFIAFASLLSSDIVPVRSFGLTMCLGIVVSLLVTYSFFASILVLLRKNEQCEDAKHIPGLTMRFSNWTQRRPRLIVVICLSVVVASAYGMSQLSIGSRITSYFRSDTDIYQGLTTIDRHLGGTVPLDIVLQFEPFESVGPAPGDPFANIVQGDGGDAFVARYWFTPEKLAIIDQVQRYLDSRPEVGKVLSLSSLERVGRTFNNGEPLNYLQLTTILGTIPKEIRNRLIEPFADPASGRVRISARLYETGPTVDLRNLIVDIETQAATLGLAPENIRVTGVALLLDDMLRELLTSQRTTLFWVLGSVLLMFMMLLKSLRLALIGVLPNVAAALGTLGIMGAIGVQLDILTITIAAIVVGIGVDDAIHYLHRYQTERIGGRSAASAVHSAHGTIGRALYFTTLTVVAGFAVLAFSRFVPTANFGLLCALAMVLTLTANLLVVPALLLVTEPGRNNR